MTLFLEVFLQTIFYMIPLSLFLFSATKKQKVGLFFVLSINIYIISLFGQDFTPLLIISVIIYLFLCSKNRLHNFCTFLICYILLVIWDNCFSLIWNFLICDLNIVLNNEKFFLAYLATSVILLYIVCSILHQIVEHSQLPCKLSLLPNRLWKLIAIDLVATVSIFVFNIVAGEKIGYTVKTILFNTMLFGFFFVISIILVSWIFQSHFRELKLQQQQETYQQLQEYTSQIESMYSSLRAFKHDYSNIMLSLSGFIEENDIGGLKNYYYDKVYPFSNQFLNNDFKLNQLSNLLVPEVKGLLSAKLIYAHELNINVTIEIRNPVCNIAIDSLDFARVLGIFLDNAIEASLQTSDPKISFVIFQENKHTTVIISNTFTEQEIPLSDLNKAGVSSKGEHRGIGLNNASNILSKYPNILCDTQTNRNLFIQHLEIEQMADIIS